MCAVFVCLSRVQGNLSTKRTLYYDIFSANKPSTFNITKKSH